MKKMYFFMNTPKLEGNCRLCTQVEWKTVELVVVVCFSLFDNWRKNKIIIAHSYDLLDGNTLHVAADTSEISRRIAVQ